MPMSSVMLILLFALWQPMSGAVWTVQSRPAAAALYTLFAAGWVLVLASTFLINHFDLFGLRQVYLHLRGRPYTQLRFGTPGIYRHIRHPLYLGWLLTFRATFCPWGRRRTGQKIVLRRGETCAEIGKHPCSFFERRPPFC